MQADASPDDMELVRRILVGEKECFALLVERHERSVFRIVQGILGNTADTEEVLQESFLNAFTHLGGFRGEAQFRTWLIRIAINEARKKVRKYKPQLHDSIDETEEDGRNYRPRELRDWQLNPEQRMASKEVAGLMERAIQALPRGYREVFLLRDVEQLSSQQAADTLGLSLSATKTRLLRARLMVREYLSPHFRQRWHQGLLSRLKQRGE